jgi:uncharacterized membrane protein
VIFGRSVRTSIRPCLAKHLNNWPVTEDNDNSQLPAGIAKIATPVIDTLPKDKRAAVAQIAREVSRYHSGPLPDPETLAHYSRIIPNGAERIMALVEREAAHRHTQEARFIDCQIKTTHYGQWMGAGLTVLLAGAGLALGVKGHDYLAGVVFATTIIAVVTIFVLGRKGNAEGIDEPDVEDDRRHAPAG